MDHVAAYDHRRISAVDSFPPDFDSQLLNRWYLLLLVSRALFLASPTYAPADTDMSGFWVTAPWPFDFGSGRLWFRSSLLAVFPMTCFTEDTVECHSYTTYSHGRLHSNYCYCQQWSYLMLCFLWIITHPDFQASLAKLKYQSFTSIYKCKILLHYSAILFIFSVFIIMEFELN